MSRNSLSSIGKKDVNKMGFRKSESRFSLLVRETLTMPVIGSRLVTLTVLISKILFPKPIDVLSVESKET